MTRSKPPTRAGFYSKATPKAARMSADEIMAAFESLVAVPDRLAEAERGLASIEEWCAVTLAKRADDFSADTLSGFARSVRASASVARHDRDALEPDRQRDWAAGFVHGYSLMLAYKNAREEFVLGPLLRAALNAREANAANRAKGIAVNRAATEASEKLALEVAVGLRRERPGARRSEIIRACLDRYGGLLPKDRQLRRLIEGWEDRGDLPRRV
jgi:hypothetical protein